jgi:hypothetical protein
MRARPLTLELEGIERAAWQSLAEAAPPDFARGIGLETADIGGAFMFMASRVPALQFNWLSGTGLFGDDGSSIADAVRRFRAVGQKTFSVQIPPGQNASRCESHARATGLAPHPLGWAKFHRDTAKPPVVQTNLQIREVGPDERDAFAATAIAGFGMPAPMASWLSQIVGRERWHAYVAYDGATALGAAAMYVDGDFAWLGIGATRPEGRRRGSQSALLARRIADAGRLGAKHATTETGVPQPGQPAPSYANILKAGFTVAYVRPNWTEPAA